ncbi:MATE family efflux transporter DinF [Veronia nyctiphanis]|uniref:MATE family efflux transporter DinF n=1 Tax=Veronia nyctiphanis TaxID=1278244 RepID=A0A4Q0YR37_9GAMM|nr:MATE family efflux transporter DinF [Veronia nyctiphanis]RXJ73043.1 MATE family efflux transporter DinF [Veronia nyctiphanis]
MTISVFKNLQTHKAVFALAFPMVLSNITVPLLGLVDTAVIGHLEHAFYLGGVAMGSTMITVLFFLLGFLRMSTTGLTAQALGANDKQALVRVLAQGVLMSLLAALVILLIHPLIERVVLGLSDASDEVRFYAEEYFSVRIWSAPATLTNMVIMGWLLGTQNARLPMVLSIVVNIFNIGLDILFVVGFDWKVQGAAAASVLADYAGLVLGIWFVIRRSRQLQLGTFAKPFASIRQGIGRFVRLNRDIFLRSLSLQLVFSFMTFQGATLGDNIIAANAVLMSFLMLISYAMDGFAYAMESMVGKAIGAKDRQQLTITLSVTTFWGGIGAVLLTVVFGVFGAQIVAIISDIDAVRSEASIYLPWLIVMPVISMWCFLLDGIFIGATRGKDMRNTMLLAMLGFFFVWWALNDFGNHALWAAMLTFMGLRGGLLAVVMFYQWRKEQFLPEH